MFIEKMLEHKYSSIKVEVTLGKEKREEIKLQLLFFFKLNLSPFSPSPCSFVAFFFYF